MKSHFLFNRVFADPNIAESEREKPAFRQEDLDSARQEGWEDGWRNGFARGETSQSVVRQQKLQETLDALLHQITRLFKVLEHEQSRLDSHAQAVGLAIARKIMPAMIANHGIDEVRALIEQVLSDQRPSPQAVVYVSPHYREELETQIQALVDSSGFQGRVVLAEDSALGLCGCRVSFADGSVERRTENLWEKIYTLIEGGHSAP